MYEKIPQELKEMPQWVGWKYVKREGQEKLSKVPCNPCNGNFAKSNNPSTWGLFADAVAAVEQFGLNGIGIMFANNIFGIDLDDCFDDKDEPKGFAQDIMAHIHSYTERSPSGKGIHILCRGRMPDGRRRNGPIEMYGETRYFTVTGNQYGPEYPLIDCTESIKAMHAKYLGEDKAATKPKRTVSWARDTNLMTVDKVLERALNSKTGDKFQDLYDGRYEQHLSGPDFSHSAGDLLFCSMLAFWTGCDAGLMDDIFRRSGMMRKKWDKRHGSDTYGNLTINKAISLCGETWTPPKFRPEPIPLPDEPPPYFTSPPPLPLPQMPDLVPEVPVEDDDISQKVYKKVYKYDDTGNAERFRDMYLGEIKFNTTEKEWMYWDGRRWAMDLTGEIKRKADYMLEEMQKQLSDVDDLFYNAFKKHITKSRSHKGKEAFIKETQHREGIPVLADDLDRPGNILNVRNCIVSLKTGQVKEHNRKLLLSKLADVNYDSAAKCPYWNKFLDDITCNDASLKLYLQRMVGYCMTASTVEQCVFFLYGNGSNGKSTFTDTIAEMLGEYAARCQSSTVMQQDKNNGARSDLARLQNIRMVVSEEPNDGCRLDEGMVKQMAGGTDNKITVRFLYSREFELIPQFKIVMSTNYKPIIKGTDNGIWRRIRLIPFTAHFQKEKQDKSLPAKLRKEMSGILNWAIDGARGWYKDGLPPCPLVDAAVQEYRAEMDRIQQFVDDCLHMEADSSIQAATLYTVYKQWCQEQGDRYPLGSMKFYTELRKRFKSKKTAAYNEYLGISLTDKGALLLTFSTKD